MKKITTLFITFLKIGAFTFGGGYAMVALLESEFVSYRRWLDKDEFIDMIAIAESTPGPMAINSATYIGLGCACGDCCGEHTVIHYYLYNFAFPRSVYGTYRCAECFPRNTGMHSISCIHCRSEAAAQA